MLDTRTALENDTAFPGICIVQGSSGMHLYQPTKASETIIRVYPEPVGNGFASYRASADPNDFTGWLAVEYAVRYVGDTQKITFIPRCKDQDPRTSEMLWDRLVRTVITAIKDPKGHPEWSPLILSGGKQGSPIPGTTIRAAKAKIHGFVQGILLKHKGTSFRQNPKPNVVLMLSPTARISLQQLCNEENKDWDGKDPEDFAKRFKCGEWLDPKTGRELIIEFRDPNGGTNGDDANIEVNFGNLGAGGLAAPNQKQAQGFANSYEVRLAAYKTPCPPDIIRKYRKPWEQVLRYLNEQEQVELMCSAFKPDVVKEAFGGLGLLPRSIEFGTVISAPPAAKAAARISAQPTAETAVETAEPTVEDDDDNAPPFDVETDEEGNPNEMINFGNMDESAPVAENPEEGATVTPPNVADPAQVDKAQERLRAVLAKARAGK